MTGHEMHVTVDESTVDRIALALIDKFEWLVKSYPPTGEEAGSLIRAVVIDTLLIADGTIALEDLER